MVWSVKQTDGTQLSDEKGQNRLVNKGFFKHGKMGFANSLEINYGTALFVL